MVLLPVSSARVPMAGGLSWLYTGTRGGLCTSLPEAWRLLGALSDEVSARRLEPDAELKSAAVPELL